MIAELNSRWAALPAGTRKLATAGAAVAGALLLYAAVWLPLQSSLVRLRVSVPLEDEQLISMRVQTPLAKTMRAKMTGAGATPSAGIEQSAIAQGVRSYITRLEGEGNSGARVTLEAVPFNTLLSWISELQSSQGLVIEEATINPHASAGSVNAQLRLRGGA